MSITIHTGDCLTILPTLPAGSIDAVVTDPPYGLEFMGKEWDGADGFRRSLNEADVGRDNAFGRTSARAPEYRTVGVGQKSRPGIGERKTEWPSHQGWNRFRCKLCGHLSHGGSPCQCEKPEFVPADNRWNLFQEWCEAWSRELLRVLKPGGHLLAFGGSRTYHRLACAVEDAGFEIRDQIQWLYGSGFPKSHNLGDGRGTALKPAHEPIVLARKPLSERTVAANVLRWRTGALNVDGCRVETGDGENRARPPRTPNEIFGGGKGTNLTASPHNDAGRWPANVVHDGSAEVVEAFPQSAGQQGAVTGNEPSAKTQTVWGSMHRVPGETRARRGDSGSAARFFYSAKASRADRAGSKHPTVKPIDLMAYLCRLVTPKGGTVLDPFAGSGSTGMACLREGYECILVEREPQYVADIENRVAHVAGGDTPLFAGSWDEMWEKPFDFSQERHTRPEGKNREA